MDKNLLLYNSAVNDIKTIIQSGRDAAYSATNQAMVLTYWNIG